MPTIVDNGGDGRRIEVEVETGSNVMQGAAQHGVRASMGTEKKTSVLFDLRLSAYGCQTVVG
jgi:hypothetical protein